MIHPTCGASLQKSTRVAAIFEIATAAAFLLLNVNGLINVLPQAMEERYKTAIEDPAKFNLMTAVLLSINTSYWTVSLCLAILLLIGANQRDMHKCRTWLAITCIVTVLFIIEILMVTFSMSASAIQVTSPIVATLLLTYIMWIVHEFMNELRLSC